MPGFVIEPSLRLTKVFPPFPGSLFGITHGLTQRGLTGTIPFGANVPEPDELNASAVAVAPLFVFRDQIRRKKRGQSRADDLDLHLRIHSEGIRSSERAICHVGWLTVLNDEQ